jgi:hypothetical protein
MKNQDIIKKLRKLENIQPSQEWQGLTRDNLINQIRWENRADQRHSGVFSWLKSFQPVALVICLLMIFVGGPWLTVMASRVSLPGDILYSVKRASENIQKKVVSKEKQSGLDIEFANRRLEEFSRITDLGEKDGKAKKVINDFKSNLSDVSVGLDDISKEEALAVAKKTIKMKEDLDKVKEEAPIDVQEDLIEAEKVIEEINNQILAVLTGDGEITENNATTTPDQEILIILEETETGAMTTTDKIINGVKEE